MASFPTAPTGTTDQASTKPTEDPLEEGPALCDEHRMIVTAAEPRSVTIECRGTRSSVMPLSITVPGSARS